MTPHRYAVSAGPRLEARSLAPGSRLVAARAVPGAAQSGCPTDSYRWRVSWEHTCGVSVLTWEGLPQEPVEG